MQVLIRRNGTLIDLSPDGQSPLPEELHHLLLSHMKYDHVKLLRGQDSYDPETGEHENVKITPTNLYRWDQHGKLVTGYGYIPKVMRVLQAAGHSVNYIDVSPARPRPDCYVPDWDNVHQHFEFRARQEECLQAINNAWGGVINATMGFGKTELFRALCHLYPLARIAIVVKPKDVAARIVRQLTQDFPGVGQVGGGQNYQGERITVFTGGSTKHSDGDYDFLFCDEVHQLMSKKMSEDLGSAFRQTRNYGFTGTPEGRLDKAHAKLEMFFGPQIFYMPYPEAVELGLVVPINVRWIKMPFPTDPAAGKAGTPRDRWGIWRHDVRHAAFAADIRENYNNNEQILMAVATVDHAIYLWRHLPDFTLCYSNAEEKNFQRYKSTGMIPHSFEPMTQSRRDSLRNAFEQGTLRRVIATDIWSTGVDFRELQVLYRCDARESEILDSQWPGRVSRLYDDKACGEVVDALDLWNKTYERKSRTRRRHYRAHGWSETGWPISRRARSAKNKATPLFDQ